MPSPLLMVILAEQEIPPEIQAILRRAGAYRWGVRMLRCSSMMEFSIAGLDYPRALEDWGCVLSSSRMGEASLRSALERGLITPQQEQDAAGWIVEEVERSRHALMRFLEETCAPPGGA